MFEPSPKVLCAVRLTQRRRAALITIGLCLLLATSLFPASQALSRQPDKYPASHGGATRDSNDARPAATQAKIAFLDSAGWFTFHWALHTINLDGMNNLVVTPIDSHSRVENFAWSPNGQKIAFDLNDGGFDHSVRVVNADGSGLTIITERMSDGTSICWSPDGSQIVFKMDDGLYVANPNDASLRQLTSDPSDWRPSWSPDGLRIAYSRSVNNEVRIFLVKPDGTAPANISSGSAPEWSPDGSKLLFTAPTAETFFSTLMVMNRDGSNQIDLTPGKSANSHGRWSADGKRILFQRDVHFGQVWTMKADGSAQTQLTPDTSQNLDPEWSSDAGRIAFGSDRDAPGIFPSIYVMNADGSGLKRLVFEADVLLPKWQPVPTAAQNPINLRDFFVRQQYLDFLNREPDDSGLNFWSNQISVCGSDANCLEVRRINVSAAFFRSIEFQETAYFVERMYKVAYGDSLGISTLGGLHQVAVPVIRFEEFVPDAQRLGHGVTVLDAGWEQALENNKHSYALGFVQTTRFTNALPPAMTPSQFVDRLNQNAAGVLSPAERTAALNLFGGASDSSNLSARAQAVRMIAEDQDLYNSEFRRAFVLAEYFGYLRRNLSDFPDSDFTGYEFWLNKLNQFNGDYIGAEMVKAFISSNEYRQRFGQ